MTVGVLGSHQIEIDRRAGMIRALRKRDPRRSNGATSPAGYPLRMPDRLEPDERSGPDEVPTPAAASDAQPETLSPPDSDRHERPQGMVPGRERRRTPVERGFMRIVATGGIIGIAAILGAVLVNQDVAGWIVGVAVGLTSVILAALLWSSRQL